MELNSDVQDSHEAQDPQRFDLAVSPHAGHQLVRQLFSGLARGVKERTQGRCRVRNLQDQMEGGCA